MTAICEGPQFAQLIQDRLLNSSIKEVYNKILTHAHVY
jgi:hypothetical protein